MTEHSLGPDKFFRLDGTPYRAVMPPEEPAWAALESLARHVAARMRPNVSRVPRRSGVVERDAVLFGGDVILEDFRITDWDAAKGDLVVEMNGKVLEGAALVCGGAVLMNDDVEIGPGSLVEPGAFIRGPAIIGPRSEVRHGAYVRGAVLVGEGCVAGHATEVKNSIFLDGARAGHFAYVGDSILGFGVNLGAGTKLANLKIVGGSVRIAAGGGIIDTGLRKLGAILGDGVETGCNSVASPGTLLAPGTLVYPNVTVPSGFNGSRKVFKKSAGRGGA